MKRSENTASYRHQWKSFFRLVKQSKVPWYLLLLTFIMDMISANLFVSLPVLLGEIMDGQIFDGGTITRYGLLSLAQVLVGFATVVLFNWVYIKMNISSGYGVWTRIIQLPMRAIMKEKPSTLTSRITDDSVGVGVALGGMFNLLGQLYTLFRVYVEMIRMNVTVSLILLIVPAWLILSMWVVGGMTYRVQMKVQNSLSAFTSFLSVRLPNMRRIKAAATENMEQQLGDRKIQEQYKAEMKMVGVSALSDTLQQIGTAIANVVVLAYGGYLTATGQMDIGDLITFFLFVTQGDFLYSSASMLMYYQNIKFGLGICAKIADLMNTEPEQVHFDKSFSVPEADIRFEDVSFGYEENMPVLEHVTCTIPSGKKTVIAGANGSGKTTILKLLERFYAPDAGNILYGTENISRYHLDEWRNSIGYVVQNSPLIRGSVADNIAYGVETPDDAEIRQAAAEADAEGFISAMEQGFDSDVGELGSKLSGGQRQKLAIARALIHHPEMMLLDEATCGLDAQSEREIDEMLDRCLAGKTIVVVSHRLKDFLNADQIIVLEDGAVAGVGTHAQLLADCEAYRSLCGGRL
ncbi:MAG: ABC transporter ATP-binding protein [Candidatus Spyradocola sp.]